MATAMRGGPAPGLPDLSGKVALVTGASRGVGLRIAERLAAAGASVTISGRTPAHGEAALATLRHIAPDAAFVAGDCASYEGARAAVAGALRGGERLDILVSSGAEGPFGPKPFSDMAPDEIEASYRTRFLPRVFPVHAALAALRASDGAAVLMVTTDAARHPTPGESIIGAVGAGVILLTKALARELSRDRIRVNGIALTLTSDTPSWDRIFSEESFERGLFSKALARFPAGRAPEAAEVARVAVFLVSEDAAQVTGQTVSVNGGLSFGGW